MSHEMCVVDPSAGDRQSIGEYFRRQGFLVAETGDAREAQGLVRDKFYPVVLVDADIEPWGGLEFVTFVRAHSPRSEVILLTVRRSFDVAVQGYRRGAMDVIYKDPSEAQRLREQVDRAVRRVGARTAGETSVFADSKSLMEEMLRRMIDLAQRDPAAQSRLAAMPGTAGRVAVVDHEKIVHEAIEKAARASAGSRAPFDATHIPSGGTALDILSSSPPDVLVVRDDLIDLPGTMLVGALAESAADATVVLYKAAPGGGAEATVFEKGHPLRTIRPLDDVDALVAVVVELVDRFAAAVVERRVMDLFRMEHADLVRRYATLRSRLDEAIRRDADER